MEVRADMSATNHQGQKARRLWHKYSYKGTFEMGQLEPLKRKLNYANDSKKGSEIYGTDGGRI